MLFTRVISWLFDRRRSAREMSSTTVITQPTKAPEPPNAPPDAPPNADPLDHVRAAAAAMLLTFADPAGPPRLSSD